MAQDQDELTGKENETLVPREKLGNYLMQLRDIKKVEAIEQARAKTIFDEGVKTREALNKPMSVGKNDTVVIPATGQQFAPKGGGIGQFDVKEANPVLDDARKMILERTSNFDQATGKWNWSPEAVAKAQTAERLFMKNPSIPPAMLADIADKGATGTAIVEIGGKQQRVPAVSHNGRTYILGGNDAGQPSPTAPKQSAIVPAAPDTTGLGTRSVRGKIAPVGLQRDMQVSPDVQAVRDVQAGRQLVAEAGGVQRAAQDLAELDAALKNPRLDGTQRGILQSHRNRLAAGIAAFQ